MGAQQSLVVLQRVRGIAFSTELSAFDLLSYHCLNLSHGEPGKSVRRTEHV